jgi:putative ABC transport system permease protein
MLRATFKSLLSRKLRLFLSGLAVILGVMFVSGAFVLTDTLSRSFTSLFQTAFVSTDVQVSAKAKVASGDAGSDQGIASLPSSVVDQVKGVPGVADASGQVWINGAQALGKNGKVISTFGAPQFGISWVGGGEQTISDGRAPSADDEVVINAGLAKSANFAVGDSIRIITMQQSTPATFHLVGTFTYPGNRGSLGGEQTIAFTTPAAQRLLLGASDSFSVINVRAGPGVDDNALRDRIAAQVGGDYIVKTGKQLADDNASDVKKGLSFFNYVLLGFAGVALFVGTFLILNTFSIIVAQRTRELALLRAMGANRRQMIGSVLTEATVIGLLASVVGLGAGIGVGALLAYLFSSAGGGLQLAGIGVPPAAVIGAFAVGLIITWVAALMPALRASRIPPIAAMRDAATADRPLTRISIIGGAVTAVGAGVLGLGLSGRAGSAHNATLWLILGGVLVSFIGVALLTPLISRPLVSALGRLFSWSVPGQLGRLNSARNPRRTATTAAALMVGVALITGVYVIRSSVTASLTQLVNTEVSVDLIIYGQQSSGIPPTFDPKVMDQVKALSGVSETATLYGDLARVDGEHTGLGAVDNVAALDDMTGLKATTGTITSIGDGQLIVDQPTADAHHLKVGDQVPVQLARGAQRTFTVTGIYAKNNVVNGWIASAGNVADFSTGQAGQGLIKLAPGTPVDPVKAQVNTLLADNPLVNVADRSEYVQQQGDQLNSVVNMIQILLGLAILIAVLGIVNTLALSVLERTRELGLLRAVGLRRGQAWRMVTVEAVVISVFGALLGVAVGSGLGAAVVRALKDQGFTTLSFPWTQMVEYLLLAAVVGVVAAVLPAIRAARVNVLEAIAYE